MSTEKAEIKISKMEIKIGGETIRLTLEQAMDLKSILNKTFPDAKTNTVYVDRPVVIHWDRWPIPVPQYPYEPNKFWYSAVSSTSGTLQLSAK